MNKKELIIGFFGGVVLTAISIWFGYYLSSPIDFEVWHNVSEDQERLVIYAKNNDQFRYPSKINLYRLEVNERTPHIQKPDDKSFKRGKEKMLFNLSINIEKENVPFTKDNCKNCFTVPYFNLFFLTEENFISYKITCDKCSPQGIVRRVPEFQMIPFSIILDPINKTFRNLSIPKYSWTEVKLEDFKK